MGGRESSGRFAGVHTRGFSSIKIQSENIPVGHPRSLLPLPNPCCTGPDNLIGNGASGTSGPTISGLLVRKDSSGTPSGSAESLLESGTFGEDVISPAASPILKKLNRKISRANMRERELHECGLPVPHGHAQHIKVVMRSQLSMNLGK